MVLQFPQDSHSRAVPALTSQTASTQRLDGTSASAASTEFTSSSVVRISAPEEFHYEIGTSPTATTSSPYVPAGVMFEEHIPGGQKIAIIKATAATAGVVWVTELE